MINITESGFHSGCISPVLYEDVAVVYINQRLRKLFKYKKYEVRITRPCGIRFALRYLYENDAYGKNAPNSMRRDISIFILNSVIGAIETKLKKQYGNPYIGIII